MRSIPDRWVLLAALAILLTAAWCSTGFQSADEHYQVIAFAEAKLGHQPINALPWEYAARIRSAFLPTVCVFVFFVAERAGLTDPFQQVFLLRLFTALSAFGVTLHFVRSVKHTVMPELRWTFLALSFFLWFLPFLNVRFTGETWSGLFLLLAMAPLLSPASGKWRYAQAGLFLGLAFLCRPPTLAVAIGFAGWLALVRKDLPSRLALLGGVFTAVLLLGIALDSWFYGGFTLTAWNYLRIGVLGHAAHPFTVFPWWYYYAWVLKYATPVFGASILLAFGLLCASGPRHPLTWAIVPFLVLHMLLPHKELRFLYPLAGLVPWLLIQATPALLTTWPSLQHLVRGKALKPMLLLLAGMNGVALCAAILTPAGSGRTHLAELIRAHYPTQPVRIHYIANDTNVWDIRIPPFYLRAGITDTLATGTCIPLVEPRNGIDLLVAKGALPPGRECQSLKWIPVASAQPRWKQWLLKIYDWEDAQPAWILFKTDMAPPAL